MKTPKTKSTRREALEKGARRMNRAARCAMRDLETDWCVVFTLSGKEFTAQKMVNNLGLTCYLPLHRKWRRMNRTTRDKIKIAYPALSGCLFIGISKSWLGWHHIFNETPLYGVLGASGKVARFSGKELDAFLERNKSKFEVPDAQKHMRSNFEFAVGDRVTVVDGALEDRIFDVDSIEGDKARILIEFLGKQQKVFIPLDRLEKAA